MFPKTIGGALELNNLADRVIKPVFKANGLKWKGCTLCKRQDLEAPFFESSIFESSKLTKPYFDNQTPDQTPKAASERRLRSCQAI
jgi:hypothetical protein